MVDGGLCQTQGKAESAVDSADSVRTQQGDGLLQRFFGNCGDGITVDYASLRKPIFGADANLGGKAAYGCCDRGDGDQAAHRIGLVTRQQQHGASLVDVGPPQFATFHSSSHSSAANNAVLVNVAASISA